MTIASAILGPHSCLADWDFAKRSNDSDLLGAGAIALFTSAFRQDKAVGEEKPSPLDSTEVIEIVDAVLGGRNNEFARIYDAYHHQVVAVVRTIVPNDAIEEVTHETFVRAFEGLSKYQEQGKFLAWLRQISVRASHDYWRLHRNPKERPAEPEMIASLLEDDELLHSKEDFDLRRLLLESLKQLDIEDRTVLILQYLEDWAVMDIAVAFNWSIAKTKIRSLRARRKLRILLAERLVRIENEA
jgi:RNA polymerase sigma-70 factor (ECF subfamily)